MEKKNWEGDQHEDTNWRVKRDTPIIMAAWELGCRFVEEEKRLAGNPKPRF